MIIICVYAPKLNFQKVDLIHLWINFLYVVYVSDSEYARAVEKKEKGISGTIASKLTPKVSDKTMKQG